MIDNVFFAIVLEADLNLAIQKDLVPEDVSREHYLRMYCDHYGFQFWKDSLLDER